jgi:hypothetical protein
MVVEPAPGVAVERLPARRVQLSALNLRERVVEGTFGLAAGGADRLLDLAAVAPAVADEIDDLPVGVRAGGDAAAGHQTAPPTRR